MLQMIITVGTKDVHEPVLCCIVGTARDSCTCFRDTPT